MVTPLVLLHNAVEYFISYYDYYQPEAYVVSDTYIAKTASINEEIDCCGTQRPVRCLNAAM